MPKWIKIIVALALLSLLFMGVHWDEVLSKISRFTWDIILIGLLGIAVQFLVCTYRWRWSLRLHGLVFSYAYLWKVYCIGFFFNNFLPSAIGGDAYRVYRTQSATGKKLRSVSAVLVERVVGLLAMLAIGAVGALFLVKSHSIALTYLSVMGAGAVAGVVFLGVIWAGWLGPLVTRLKRFAIFDALEANARYIFHWSVDWIVIIMASVVFQLTAAGILFVLFRGIGNDMGFAQCALIAAAAGLASVLPISINGIGVVEGSIAGSAIALGADYDSALLVAIALRILILPANALCGLVYLFDRQPAPLALNSN